MSPSLPRLALGAWLAAAACGPSSSEPPGFPLGSVVAPAIAELEGRVEPAREPPAPDDAARERAIGLVTMYVDAAPDLRALVLEDARGLPAAAVPVLGELLGDPEAEDATRDAAARVLGVLGAIGSWAAAEVLCVGLETGDAPWLRRQCAFQLGEAGQDRFLPRMTLRLKYEEDGATVVWLAVAVARLGSYAGLDGLVVVSGSAEPALRELAAAKLADLAREAGLADGVELVERWSSPRAGDLPLPEPSDALRLEVWRRVAALAEWDLRAVDDGRFVLSRSAPWVAGVLARALHEDDVYVRVHAAQCLERMGPRAAAAGPALLEALAEPRVAPAAAAALGGTRHAPAAPVLASLVTGAGDPELAIAAARALGHLPGAPLDELRTVLRGDAGVDLRQAAAVSLLELGDVAEASAFLVERLTDRFSDSGAAEDALGAWLARRAVDGAAGEELLAAWSSLGPPEGTIPTAGEVLERQRARAELLRRSLGGP